MNRKTTIASATIALGLGIAVAVPVAVQAHTPDLTCQGDTLHLSLTNYPAGSTVTAVLDGVTLLDGTTFGPQPYTASQAIDTTTDHTYSVTVRGADGQGNRDYAGTTSVLCGYTVTPPVTETPTPTPEPTTPVETPTPTDEPTPPVTPEPTTEPTPGDTPSPTTPAEPEATPTSAAPVIAPTAPDSPSATPTSAVTPSAPIDSADAPPAQTDAVVTATDDTERADRLAYTGTDVAVPATIAGLLLVAGALVLVYRRRMSKRASR